MNASNARSTPTRKQIGEASAWMAVLRAPDRTLAIERGFQRWLAENPGHKVAFEAVSTAWEETAGLPPAQVKRSRPLIGSAFKQGFMHAAGVAAALLIMAAGGLLYYQRYAGVTTDIGEQRTLTLQDGSRIYLNTDTRVIVRYDDQFRKVELKQGEALFDVAKVPGRPFIVAAGDQEIRALGTAFVVRQDNSRLVVTLVEGKIGVFNHSHATETQRPAEAFRAKTVLLSPGERLTLAPHQKVELDRPVIEKVTAWRTGQVDLAKVRLADAAEEMNRYSRTKVVIERPETAGMLISGIFRAGDIDSFAHAIADTYGLEAKVEEGRIVITGVPQGVLKPN